MRSTRNNTSGVESPYAALFDRHRIIRAPVKVAFEEVDPQYTEYDPEDHTEKEYVGDGGDGLVQRIDHHLYLLAPHNYSYGTNGTERTRHVEAWGREGHQRCNDHKPICSKPIMGPETTTKA